MQTRVTFQIAKSSFDKLLDRVSPDHETIIITRDGLKDVVMLPMSELAGLIETVHLLGSPNNSKRPIRTLNQGRT